MLDVKSSGIYKIQNKINNHIYVGSSVKICDRWKTHKSELNRQTHHSNYLQNAWNKYGEENFEFIIIENCEKENLIVREQYYIDEYTPKYNISPTAGNCLGVKGSPESNYKKSLNHAFKEKYGKDHPSSKIIYQYDLKGNFIKEWYGADEIQRVLGFDAANIRSTINYRKGIAYKFFWSYENHGDFYESIPKYRDRSSTCKIIEQYDLNYNLIKTYFSISEASSLMCGKKSKASSAINNALKDQSRKAYGFYWKYKDQPFNISPKKEWLGKPIKQFSLAGEFIKEWRSISQVLRYLKVAGNSKLNQHLKGETNEYKGYVWKYSEEEKSS